MSKNTLDIYTQPLPEPGSQFWYSYQKGYKVGLIEGQEIQINEKSIFYKEIAKESVSFVIIIVLSLIIGYFIGLKSQKIKIKHKPLGEYF